jgi:hypothetical protein
MREIQKIIKVLYEYEGRRLDAETIISIITGLYDQKVFECTDHYFDKNGVCQNCGKYDPSHDDN